MQRDVEEHKQKLLRSEQGLQTSQSKEQDLRKKMEVSRLMHSLTLDLLGIRLAPKWQLLLFTLRILKVISVPYPVLYDTDCLDVQRADCSDSQRCKKKCIHVRIAIILFDSESIQNILWWEFWALSIVCLNRET